MKRLIVSAITFLVVLSSGARGQDSSAAKAKDSSAVKSHGANPLGATYPVQLGDIAAGALSEMLKLRTDFDPAIITYEPATGTVDVGVFGAPAAGSKTDHARTTLGKYWEFIQAAHIPYVERRYGVKLTVQRYKLMYYDRSAKEGPKLILQFVNGQYLIP